jgi:PIN domain nuclease of toxin-antitoxin system
MKMLLNTHAFLWFIAGDSKLSDKAKTSIEDGSNDKIVSMASMWEMAIKISIGNFAQYRKAEEELRQLEERLKRLKQQHPLGAKGFNKAGIRKSGYPLDSSIYNI